LTSSAHPTDDASNRIEEGIFMNQSPRLPTCFAAAAFACLTGFLGTAAALNLCKGGSNDHMLCTTNSECPGGTCVLCNGLANCPLPVLEAGKPTYHLYTVSGITSTGGLGTFFSCTSTDTAPMQVGVETFLQFGGGPANNVAPTSLTVSSGAMVTFGTGSAVAIAVDSAVFPCGSCRGSARILSTSKKLVCTAYIADRFNAPPTSMTELKVVKNKTQKGD
jgi:hypothetical protein